MSATNLVVDLFGGGAGGWEVALTALGVRAVGIEMDAGACLTRAAAGLLTIRADVATFPLDRLVGRVWGITGSPPCQDFSKSGKRKGLGDDGPPGELCRQHRRRQSRSVGNAIPPPLAAAILKALIV